jgi:hypothetical protein
MDHDQDEDEGIDEPGSLHFSPPRARLSPLSSPARPILANRGSITPAVIAWNCSLPYLAIMKVIRDCFGRSVRLTDERLAHILEHPEMAGMEDELARVLQSPSEVRLSRSDDNVKLFYEFYTQTQVGGKWLCVVVKYGPGDAFVITAYLTDTVKAGEIVWPKR